MIAPSGNAAWKITCSRCGGENPSDAIFCRNPDCKKALGHFKYSAEEIDRESRVHEKMADRVSAFIGSPYFIVL